jgi:TolB protein
MKAGILLLVVAAGTLFAQQKITSHIHISSADGKHDTVIYTASKRFEAPNWSPDGKYLLMNSDGKLWKLPVQGGEPAMVDSGSIDHINNDHGISKDGKWIAISSGDVYVLPSEGGTPKQLTNAKPSYFHGWSPDGQTLAFCANRAGNFDIYTVAAGGGPEVRLTTSPGYDDGPDYSPDGKWIYFNSDRSGSWDIWRMPATGAGPDDAKAERVTSDDYEDWFAHPSPDGKWLVLISFEKGTKGHPANQNVMLRRMRMPGDHLQTPKLEVIKKLFGGQGTMNVNSWSPDSKRFAYVSYSLD